LSQPTGAQGVLQVTKAAQNRRLARVSKVSRDWSVDVGFV
jgi:hypothetical protein